MPRSMLLLGMSLLAAPLAAQQTPASGGVTAQSGTPAQASGGTTQDSGASKVVVGATVSDTQGGPVGTIASISGGNATIDTGTVKAAVPVTSFAQRPSGLVLGMTKAQLEAAVAQAKPTDIAVGTQVVGPQGGSVGTVAEVNDTLVTLQMPSGKVQLPKNAFAQNASGALVIGMTQAQLEAAAKAAAGANPS